LRQDINLSRLRTYVYGAMNWRLEWVKPGMMSASALAQQLCDILFNGIGSAPQPRG